MSGEVRKEPVARPLLSPFRDSGVPEMHISSGSQEHAQVEGLTVDGDVMRGMIMSVDPIV